MSGPATGGTTPTSNGAGSPARHATARASGATDKRSAAVIPAGHPHTGVGGTQPSSSSLLFTLAGLAAAGATVSSVIALRRGTKPSRR